MNTSRFRFWVEFRSTPLPAISHFSISDFVDSKECYCNPLGSILPLRLPCIFAAAPVPYRGSTMLLGEDGTGVFPQGVVMAKNPKPARKDVGSSPSKKAALPRRNKAGKKPHKIGRIIQVIQASGRVRRKRLALGRGVFAPEEIMPRGHETRKSIRNPGKDIASHAEMQRVRRNEGSQAVDRRKKKVKNPKGG